jgi:hypothetical protein
MRIWAAMKPTDLQPEFVLHTYLPSLLEAYIQILKFLENRENLPSCTFSHFFNRVRI